MLLRLVLQDGSRMFGAEHRSLPHSRIGSGAGTGERAYGSGIEFLDAQGITPFLDNIPANAPVITNGFHGFHFDSANQVCAKDNRAGSVPARP